MADLKDDQEKLEAAERQKAVLLEQMEKPDFVFEPGTLTMPPRARVEGSLWYVYFGTSPAIGRPAWNIAHDDKGVIFTCDEQVLSYMMVLALGINIPQEQNPRDPKVRQCFDMAAAVLKDTGCLTQVMANLFNGTRYLPVLDDDSSHLSS